VNIGISIVGLVVAFGLLLFLMMKGVHLFVSVMAATAVVVLTSWLNLHESLVQLYIGGFTTYYKSWFFQYFWGIMLGIVMAISGGATSIARFIIKVLKDKAYFAIPCATAALCIGGVAAIAATFPVIPIALAIFREYNYPRRLMPAFLFFGACTFAMVAPGVPQIQNILPATTMGVDIAAGKIGGLVGCGTMAIVGFWWLRHMLLKAVKNGEHFEARPSDTDTVAEKLPNPLISVLPLVFTIVCINVKNGEGKAIFATETAVAIGVVSAVVLLFPYIDRSTVLKHAVHGIENTANTVFSIATIVGFGSVVKATVGFTWITTWLSSWSLPYLISVAVGTTLICGICGSASGGLGIAAPIFKSLYPNLDYVSNAAMARIMSLSSCALDSMPHNGAVCAIITMCGETHKDAYIPIMKISVITPAIGTLAALIYYILFSGVA